MNRVLDRLYIGSAHDLEGVSRGCLRALGFSAILILRAGKDADETGVQTLRIANRDGDPWTKEQVVQALDFIARNILTGRVLVTCAAGMSRSASMVIGYLVRVGWDAASAYVAVKQARPEIAPVAEMVESVLRSVG